VTIEELNNDLEQAASDLTTVFAGFYLCASDLKDAMTERIFVKSIGADGQQLPSKPYSYDPIYVDPNSLPRSVSSFQVGKTGKKIKSAYFPNGYGQLKTAIGRGALELTNNLFLDFTNTPQVDDFNKVKILVDDNNVGKISGLEKLYGVIFFPTDDELNDLVDCIETQTALTLER